MNCSYRWVWNRATGVMQVASELAKSHSRGGRSAVAKSALKLPALGLLLGVFTQPAWAITQTVTSRVNNTTTFTALASSGNTLVYSVAGNPANGGAIYVGSGATLNAGTDGAAGSALQFTGNNATYGGAIDAEGVSAAIANTVFTANGSSHGGGVFNSGTSTLAITSSRFLNNTAVYGGGVDTDGRTTITGSSFTNNLASDAGGGFYSSLSSTLSNNTFTGNSATNNGGGGLNYGTLASTGDTFTGNTAGIDGGGLYNSNSGVATLTSATFTSNSSGGDGGAIENSNQATLTVNGSHFSGNGTSGYGGAVDNYDSTATLNASNFSGNHGGIGGAVDNYQDGSASVLTLTDSNFTQNYADYGGAVYNYAGTLNINVSGGATSTFSGNTADRETGVFAASSLYLDQAGSLNVHVAAGGLLDMRDPMSGIATGSLSVTKTGSGLWALGGGNVFTSIGTGATAFNVAAGSVYLDATGETSDAGGLGTTATVAAGSLELDGAASTFTLGSGATLVAAGNNSISTAGSIILANGAILRGGTAADATSNTLTTLGGNTSLTLSATGGVKLQGTLNLQSLTRSDNFILNANLTNSAGTTGKLLVTGAGNVTLAGTSTYTGNTTINGGNLIIAQGGSAKTTSGVTDNGHLTVDGTGSALTANGTGTPFQVGSSGTGTLTLSNGAAVESKDELNLGQVAGDSGTVVVTRGATLKVATSINIGKSGTGNLTVADGGHLLIGTAHFSIADQAGSTGTVLVTGAGSSIANTGILTEVGNRGSGTLTLADGATVTTQRLIIADTAGSQGTLNIGAAAGSAAIAAGMLASTTASFGLGSGSLVFNHTNSAYVFAPLISGAGRVNVLAGTTIFTASNTYTSGTTISGGTLQIGNGGTQGSIQGNVVDNAVLAFDRSDSRTFNGAVSGSGSVTQSGTGTTTLIGANTYSGGTTVSAGTLQIGNGGIQGSIQGNVTDNAALVFNRSDATAFNGAISGSGTVTQTGGGTLSLTGVSSYLGGTRLDAGALSIGNAGAIGSGTLAMAENTQLNFASSFNLANRITLTGDPYVDVAAGSTTELSGVIADGSLPGDLVKLGAGTLVLTGADTYSGATEVRAGTLDVQGSLASAVTVDNAALLTGSGSVGDLNVMAGSTVTPGGAAIGTLTVNGNLNVAAGSTYKVTANDAGQSDLLNVNGTATLAGGSVDVAASGARWNLTHRYVLLTASNGVTGQFADAVSDFAFLTPTLGYDANNVYLTLARNDLSFASAGATQNQKATAAGLESLDHDAGLYQAILPLTASAAQSAFDNLAGASLASTRTAIIEDSRYVRDAVGQHLLEPATASPSGANLWSSTWGHWGADAGSSNATAQHNNGSGLVVGVDGQVSDLRVGALVGQHQLDNSAGSSHANSTATDLGIYADTDLGALHVQGGAIYSRYDTHSHRNIDVAPYAGSAAAHYASGVAQGFIDAGYRFSFGNAALTPFANVARVSLHQDGYREHHSEAALDVHSSDSTVTYGTLGLRASYTASARTELHASLGEQHAWGDLTPVNNQRFTSGGDSFQIIGVPVARDAAVGELGAGFSVSPAFTLGLNAHGQFGNGSTDHDVRVSAEYRF